jgi:hypothetical protein
VSSLTLLHLPPAALHPPSHPPPIPHPSEYANGFVDLDNFRAGSPLPPGRTGAEIGQINKSADIEKQYEQRLADAREKVKEAGTGWKSEYDPTGKLKEGDRDPMSGRLILDPLKVMESL